MASDLGAMREHIDEGQTGWLVMAGDVDAWRQVLSEAMSGVRRIGRPEVVGADVIQELAWALECYGLAV